MHFMIVKEVEEMVSGFAGLIHISKTAHLQQLNEMQSCQLGK